MMHRIDDVPYQGHQLAILWDKMGIHYDHGPGRHVLVDGEKIATSRELKRLEVQLPSVKQVPRKTDRPLNYAVNNDGDYDPRDTASYVAPNSSMAMNYDGELGYDVLPYLPPRPPVGNQSNTLRFAPITAAQVRAVFTHAGGARSDVTELEVWHH